MSALSPMAGPPPGALAALLGAGSGPAPSAGPSNGDWEQDLQDALAALRKSAADAPDHVEAAIIDKCVAAIQGLLAQRQKGAESALGVQPAHKAMALRY